MSEWKLMVFNEWGIAGLYVVSHDNINFPIAKVCDQYRLSKATPHDVLAPMVPDDVSTMANARLIVMAPKLRDRIESVREELSKILKLSELNVEVFNKIEKQVSEITNTLKELEVIDAVDADNLELE
jgi:hypothetical protein